METVLYGAFFVCWCYWISARAAQKVDIALGLILASLTTCVGLRVLWLFVEVIKAVRASNT